MKFIPNIITLITILFTYSANASDLVKEQRWADSIEDTIMDGDIVMLNDGKNEFLSIMTDAIKDKKRAAIIVHGTGIHPDWPQIILPLRMGLTDHGWHTLSIQMPILPNGVKYPEYAPLYPEVAPRINAAIKYLNAEGFKKIVLVGHSQGSIMGSYFLSTNKNDIQAFVGIGMPDLGNDIRMKNSESLKKITIPVLDIYGTGDLESVLSTSKQRIASAKTAGNKNYKQIIIKDADHFFKGKEKELLKKIAAWMEKLD